MLMMTRVTVTIVASVRNSAKYTKKQIIRRVLVTR